MRANGVHCRESPGTAGPVNLKVVRVMGAAFSDIIMAHIVRLYFSTPIPSTQHYTTLHYLVITAGFVSDQFLRDNKQQLFIQYKMMHYWDVMID